MIIICLAPPPTSRDDVNAPVVMDKLHTLSFSEGGRHNHLLHFLAQYAAPELRTIEVEVPTPPLIVYPALAESETLRSKVRGLSIVWNFLLDFNCQPDIRPDIQPVSDIIPKYSLPHHHSPSVVPCSPSRVWTYYHNPWSPVYLPRGELLELIVNISWRQSPWLRPPHPDISLPRTLKRPFEAGIRYSLSKAIQCRSGCGFPTFEDTAFRERL